MFAGAALALVLAVPCPQGTPRRGLPRQDQRQKLPRKSRRSGSRSAPTRSASRNTVRRVVVITTTKATGGQEVREYRLLSKDNTRTLVQTTAPAIDRGQILLMRDKDLWAFLPSVSQPVRLPLSQKLTGQVANGDLARANFVGDYHPKLLRTEEIDGQNMYVLELTAAERGVTYHRVIYWVNASNYHPHKAEFYTLSNRLMKICHYTDFKVSATRSGHSSDHGRRPAPERDVRNGLQQHGAARAAGKGVQQGLPEEAEPIAPYCA